MKKDACSRKLHETNGYIYKELPTSNRQMFESKPPSAFGGILAERLTFFTRKSDPAQEHRVLQTIDIYATTRVCPPE